MNKILLLAVVSALCISFAGCGAGDVNTNSDNSSESKTESIQSEDTDKKINDSDYSNDFDGLVNYLKACEIINNDTEGNARSYSYLGAVNGKAYSYNSITVEIYQMYDKNSEEISDTGLNKINEVKSNGYVTILDTTLEAFVSDNSKFLIIYLDNSDSEDSKKAKEKFFSAVNEFHKDVEEDKDNVSSNTETESKDENSSNTESEPTLSQDENTSSQDSEATVSEDENTSSDIENE